MLDRCINRGAKEIRKKTVLAHRNEEEAYFLVILYFVVTLDASFLCFEPIYSCDVLWFNISSLFSYSRVLLSCFHMNPW